MELKRLGGSPQTALNGQFELDIKALFSEAWEITKTTKGPLLQSAFIIFIVLLLSNALFPAYQAELEEIQDLAKLSALDISSILAIQALISLFTAGLIMMGLKNAVRFPFSTGADKAIVSDNHIRMIFDYFPQALPIIAVELIRQVGMVISLLAFTILASTLSIDSLATLGLFFALFFNILTSFSVALVIKERLPFLKAMTSSIRIVASRITDFITIYLILFLLALLASFTLGIGFIWLIPFFFNLKGVLYRHIVGIETYTQNQSTSL